LKASVWKLGKIRGKFSTGVKAITWAKLRGIKTKDIVSRHEYHQKLILASNSSESLKHNAPKIIRAKLPPTLKAELAIYYYKKVIEFTAGKKNAESEARKALSLLCDKESVDKMIQELKNVDWPEIIPDKTIKQLMS